MSLIEDRATITIAVEPGLMFQTIRLPFRVKCIQKAVAFSISSGVTHELRSRLGLVEGVTVYDDDIATNRLYTLIEDSSVEKGGFFICKGASVDRLPGCVIEMEVIRYG